MDRTRKRAGRHVDQVRDQRFGRSLEQRLQLAPVSGAELDDPSQSSDAGENLTAMIREQPALRPCDAVPRQFADGIKQGGPERIVEISRRQLPRRQLQVAAHVIGKRRTSDYRRVHRAHRKVAYTYG
jgi:hypothetical protein